MTDRIVFALLGFLTGTILAVVVWFLYGLAFSKHITVSAGDLAPSLMQLITYIGGASAILGFMLKEKAADFLGGAFSSIFEAERANPSLSQALVILGIILLVALIVIAAV